MTASRRTYILAGIIAVAIFALLMLFVINNIGTGGNREGAENTQLTTDLNEDIARDMRGNSTDQDDKSSSADVPTLEQTAEQTAPRDRQEFEDWDALAIDDPLTRSIGDRDAPIKMMEFMSLTCNHCASFHTYTLPKITERYIDNGDILFVIKPFPIDAASLQAASIARCLPEDQYFAYIKLLFDTQEDWTQRSDYQMLLRRNAKLAGLGDDEFDACLTREDIRSFIANSVAQANREYQLQSTPTFVIWGPYGDVETVRGAQPLYEFERILRKVSDGEIAKIIQTDGNITKTDDALND